MRKLSCVLFPAFLLLVACGGDGTSTIGGNNGLDGGLKSLNDAHFENNPGQQGSSCSTACDCQGGLACVGGTCQSSSSGAHCCSSSSCPSGAACQNSDGTFSTCGGSGGSGGSGGVGGTGGVGGAGGAGGVGGTGGTGGAGGVCSSLMYPCMSDTDCALAAVLGCTHCMNMICQ